MGEYPDCPLCKEDGMMRHARINRTSYWRCWKCRNLFDKDILFVQIEVPKFIKQLHKSSEVRT